MAAGRCAGCGRVDSARKIALHVLACQGYIELFERNPEAALTPEAELLRFRREDDTPEARAVARGQRLHERFTEINRQQAASASRWACPPDILE
jgi:hypothetical protein